MDELPYVCEFLSPNDQSLYAAVDILFDNPETFVKSYRNLEQLIISCQAHGQTTDENPGMIGRTVTLYAAASNYCEVNGGVVETRFPRIAADFTEMQTVKYEGEPFRNINLYKHLN